MPAFVKNIRRSNSQGDLRSSSHFLDEENDEDQFADVGNSALVHYASDGDLNRASAFSKEVLDTMKRELPEFSNECQLPSLEQAAKNKPEDSTECQLFGPKNNGETFNVAATNQREPKTLSEIRKMSL